MFRVTYLFPILLLSMSPVANASVGKVEASAGSVVLVHGGQSAAPAPGAALETNDIVRTEAGGSARVVLTVHSVGPQSLTISLPAAQRSEMSWGNASPPR